MYGPPLLFFKAVAAETGDEVQQQVAEAVGGQLKEQRSSLAQIDKQLADLSWHEAKLRRDRRRAGQPSGPGWSDSGPQLRPNWLLWRHAGQGNWTSGRSKSWSSGRSPKSWAASPTAGLSWSARQWGAARCCWSAPACRRAGIRCRGAAGGVGLRPHPPQHVAGDVPDRGTSPASSRCCCRCPADRSARFALQARDVQEVIGQPGGQPVSHEQPLSVDALGGDRYGITLGNWTRRGVYRVTAARAQDSAARRASKTSSGRSRGGQRAGRGVGACPARG